MNDLPAGVGWYGEVLGVRAGHAGPGVEGGTVLPLIAPDGSEMIRLVRLPEGDRKPASGIRLLFRVPGRRLMNLLPRLGSLGVTASDGRSIGPDHLRAEPGGGWSLRFADPWGNALALMTPDHDVIEAWLGGLALPTEEPPARSERRVQAPRGLLIIAPPHPATLDEAELLRHCDIVFGRTSGPGGQHRNRVETAVELTHRPTGMVGWAGERRRQAENRAVALRRLRLRLAIRVRTEIRGDRARPSALWERRRQGTQIPVNPKNPDYPALLAEALDLIWARRFDVAGAAGVLGVSMSQLARLVRHERHAFAMVNEGRLAQGLPALR